MKTFRTLELAIEFNKLANERKISGHLRDQLVRAASSIALNLAEGNAKFSVKDKNRYFQSAYGSLRECQIIFRLLELKDTELDQKADQLGGCLYKLIRANQQKSAE